MSKTFITVTISVVTTTPTVGRICGSVTRQNTCDSVAPSIRAASVSSVGTALIAEEKMTMAKPVWIQMRITISHMLLNGVSLRNSMVSEHVPAVLGRAEPAEPGAEQAVEQEQHDQRRRRSHQPARVISAGSTTVPGDPHQPEDDRREHGGDEPLLPTRVAQLAETDPDAR